MQSNQPIIDRDALERALRLEQDARLRAEDELATKCRELDKFQQNLDETIESFWDNSARYAAIMDNVPASIIALGPDGSMEKCNRATEQGTGYSETELIGRNYRILFEGHENDKDAVGQVDLLRGSEVSGLRKDGSTFPMEVTIVRLDGSQEKDQRYILFARDISWRREADRQRESLENDLRHSQKLEALGTISGGIAHEINTPVQYLGDNIRFFKDAFAELSQVIYRYKSLAETAVKTSDFQAQCNEIEKAAEDADLDYLLKEVPVSLDQTLDGVERISEIVRAIRQFSHPDSGEKTMIDLNEAIRTALTVSRNQWKYVAEIETELDPQIPSVPALSGEINQVLLNLIVNATHAIEDKNDGKLGVITIATGQDGPWVEFLISDTGVGIPEKNMGKIFEPFFTTKEPGRGTGQGMAIAYTIIKKKHAGKISCISVAGQGAMFVVRLPKSGEAQVSEGAK